MSLVSTVIALVKNLKDFCESFGVPLTRTALALGVISCLLGVNFYFTHETEKKIEQLKISQQSQLDKLMTRLGEIEDGYWIKASIYYSDESKEYSLAMLPISRSDDAYMQLFIPEAAKDTFSDKVKLLVNGRDVPVRPYMATFPTPLPKELISDRGLYQQFKLICAKDAVLPERILDKVWILVAIRRPIIITSPTQDKLATYRN